MHGSIVCVQQFFVLCGGEKNMRELQFQLTLQISKGI